MNETMNDITLTADCSQCVALCCLAFAFDKGSQFAIDKPAGSACPKLDDHGRCTIHETLIDKGFNGCVRYTCFGAGQRVTQDLFDGKSWQNDAALKRPMIQTFEAMRHLHEMLILLNEAEKLPLSQREAKQLGQLKLALHTDDVLDMRTLMSLERGTISRDVRLFIKSLRKYVSQS